MAVLIQTNFTAGELSPRLKGRVDLEQYSAGADTILNFQVLPAGGLTRRCGTRFIFGAKFDTMPSIRRPFVVADLTAYVLELGNLYLRIIRNRAPVLDGGGLPLEIATPYLVAELRDLRFAQSADVLYITHVNHQPMALSRTAGVFSLAVVAFSNGPYDTENTGNVGANGAAPPATSNPDAGTVAPPVASGSGTPTNVDQSEGSSGRDGGDSGGDPGGGEDDENDGSDPGGDGEGGQGAEADGPSGGAGLG